MKKVVFLLAVVLSVIGCEKMGSKLQLNTTEVRMYALEEHTITSNGTNVSFRAENPFVASVNETTGKLEANHIGETKVKVLADQGEATVKVTVIPKYNAIKDPYIKWGATLEEVKANVGVPTEMADGSPTYMYGDESKGDTHLATGYLMTEGKLSGIMVVLNNSKYQNVALHLAERFQYTGTSGGSYAYMDALSLDDATTAVVLYKMSGRWVVIYAPKTK